jgi:hypothetical protein
MSLRIGSSASLVTAERIWIKPALSHSVRALASAPAGAKNEAPKRRTVVARLIVTASSGKRLR